MLCGYEFSNHHVPVHLGYIFLFTIKFVFVVSMVCSLLSDNRKLFWERRRSEEEATQSKCNGDWMTSKSSF